MEIIRSFVMLYILVSFLLQILGDLQLSRYVRFFSGILFMLVLMTPFYEWLTKEDVSRDVSAKMMWHEYEEARNYEQMLQENDALFKGQATGVLIDEMNAFLEEEGYEVMEYEVYWTEEGEISELVLYINHVGGKELSGEMKSDGVKAMELKEKLSKVYEPDFSLEVYCNE